MRSSPALQPHRAAVRMCGRATACVAAKTPARPGNGAAKATIGFTATTTLRHMSFTLPVARAHCSPAAAATATANSRVVPLALGSESLTEGEIGTWHVPEGGSVAVDDIVVELMTDKTTVEVRADAAGVVLAHHAAEGDTVVVGAPLFTIDESAEAQARAQGQGQRQAKSQTQAQPEKQQQPQHQAHPPASTPRPASAEQAAHTQHSQHSEAPWRVPSVRFRHGNFVRSYLQHLEGSAETGVATSPVGKQSEQSGSTVRHETADDVPMRLRRRVVLTESLIDLIESGGASQW